MEQSGYGTDFISISRKQARVAHPSLNSKTTGPAGFGSIRKEPMSHNPETQLIEIAPQRLDEFSETQLVEISRQSLTACHFTIGAAAAIWCHKYTRGRTDADFGALVGLTVDQIYDRRRVWNRFRVSGLDRKFVGPDWSHYRLNVTRPGAPELLE
jgi:hypothetical protein